MEIIVSVAVHGVTDPDGACVLYTELTGAAGVTGAFVAQVAPTKPDLHLHPQSLPATLPIGIPFLPQLLEQGTVLAQVLPEKPRAQAQPQFPSDTEPTFWPPFRHFVWHLATGAFCRTHLLMVHVVVVPQHNSAYNSLCTG